MKALANKKEFHTTVSKEVIDELRKKLKAKEEELEKLASNADKLGYEFEKREKALELDYKQHMKYLRDLIGAFKIFFLKRIKNM